MFGGTAALRAGFVEVATPDAGDGVRDGVGSGGERSDCASLAAGAIVSADPEQRSLSSDRGETLLDRKRLVNGRVTPRNGQLDRRSS